MVSENASLLAAMQRADKNIKELLEKLGREFHDLRKNAIDAELSYVLVSFEVSRKSLEHNLYRR